MPVDQIREDVRRELISASINSGPRVLETTAPDRRRRRLLPTSVGAIALVSAVVYILVALWLREHVDYAIGDAIARTANAKQMVFSRDPHLAALGLVWPPFPTVAQIPLVLLLEPFGRADLAGPISTSITMALAVLVVGRTCRALGLGTVATAAFTCVFAFNPVIVFTAANGMSEAAAFLFAAITLLGLLRYWAEPAPGDLVTIALGLVGLVMVRVEAVGVIPIVVAGIGLMDFNRRDRRGPISSMLLVALPPIWAFSMWLIMQWVIKGDPLFFTSASGSGKAPTHATSPHLPDVDANPFNAVWYVLRWMAIFSPAFVLIAPIMLVGKWRTLMAALAMIGAAMVFPAATAVLLYKKASFGNPRYFVTAILFGVIGAAWLLARVSHEHRWLIRLPRAALATVLIATTAVGSVTATIALSDPEVTSVEGEGVFFAHLTGGDPNASLRRSGQGQAVVLWRKVAKDLETRVPRGEHVLIDANFAFAAPLYSHRPRSYVINSDRDYEAIVADPSRLPEFIIALPGRPGDIGARLVAADPGAWQMSVEYDGVQIFRRNGTAGREPSPLGGPS